MELNHSAKYQQTNSVAAPLFTPSDHPFRFHRSQLYTLEKNQSHNDWLCLPVSGSNLLQQWLKLEKFWSYKKVSESEIGYTVSIVSNEYERSAILRGLLRNSSFTSITPLLDWIGDRTLNNWMIIELFKQNLSTLKGSSFLLSRLSFLLGNPSLSEKQATALLSLAALHPALELPETQTNLLFQRFFAQPGVAFALLEYLVSHQKIEFLIQWVEKTLEQSDMPFPLNLAVWLSLKQIQPSLFETFFHNLKRLNLTEDHPLDNLKGILERILSLSTPQNDLSQHRYGLTIAQFMFHGSINQPGVGDSGGLSIFLNQLGNALAENQNIRQIITFVTSTTAVDLVKPLKKGNPNHLLVTLPIHDQRQIDKNDYVAYPLQLRTLLRLFLNEIAPLPDIFHLRFNDIHTLTAAEIARQMNIKTALTLTADPHRAIEKHFETKTNLDADDDQTLTVSLFRVLIADRLLHQSDAIVLLPSKQGVVDLLPYFPQIPQIIQQKTFAVIPEGIEIAATDDLQNSPLEPILAQIKRSKEDPSHINRRLIMNVGRLSPIKQQDLLVEVWLQSGLWQTTDLILIGGSPSNPTPTEQKMLRSIEKLLQQFPAAKPYFFLLPALPNGQIRALETFLKDHYPFRQPPVYVCSSLKEEFGIAILEAMSAGWLAIGPQAGGLSSYIQDGENGFLADTSEIKRFEQKLLTILSIEEQELGKISARGQNTVRENYDIHRISELLVDLYIKTASDSIQKPLHENYPDHQPSILLTL